MPTQKCLRHVAEGAKIQDHTFSGEKSACSMLQRAQNSRIALFWGKKAPAACCRGHRNPGSHFLGKKQCLRHVAEGAKIQDRLFLGKKRLRHVAEGAKIQDRTFSGKKSACGMLQRAQKSRIALFLRKKTPAACSTARKKYVCIHVAYVMYIF